MKKQFWTLKDLEKCNSIVCYGVGGAFYSFFNMPFAAKILERVKFCIDRNCNRKISIQGKNILVKSSVDFLGDISHGDVIFVTATEYSDEIETQLNGMEVLDQSVCISLRDMYYKWTGNESIADVISQNASRQRIIPKTIHWCWFGGNPLTDRVRKCIKSWEKFCPAYDISRWDEKNFDVAVCDYTREAYDSKKWAFVSDFFRLWVLYNCGGIYLDSDVEVTNNLDAFLCHNAFSGFEDNIRIPTGIMGSEKHGSYVKYLLGYYKDRHFINNGTMDLTTNVQTISRMTFDRYQYECRDHYFEIEGEFAMYPREVFCPITEIDRTMNRTANTCTIHHFADSWF